MANRYNFFISANWLTRLTWFFQLNHLFKNTQIYFQIFCTLIVKIFLWIKLFVEIKLHFQENCSAWKNAFKTNLLRLEYVYPIFFVSFGTTCYSSKNCFSTICHFKSESDYLCNRINSFQTSENLWEIWMVY